MMLKEELRRRLLEDRGIHVKEYCDKCGQLLGAVRYTRRGELGEWCSRECRGVTAASERGARAEFESPKRKDQKAVGKVDPPRSLLTEKVSWPKKNVEAPAWFR